VDAAWRLVGYFKSHARRVHAAIARGPANPDALALLGWIRRNGKDWFRLAEVSDDLRARFRDNPDALAAAVAALSRLGMVRPRPEAIEPGRPGRRPSTAFDVHPELLGTPENTGNPENPPDGGTTGPISRNSRISRRWSDGAPGTDREVFEL
jgi:hypothetical protein